jgi:hypothetical protein
MVIDDLDFMCVATPPRKADTPLIVDANTVLPFAVTPQGLKVIAWRRCQIAQFRCAVELTQFASGHKLNRAKPLLGLAVVKALRLLAAKRLDHRAIL